MAHLSDFFTIVDGPITFANDTIQNVSASGEWGSVRLDAVPEGATSIVMQVNAIEASAISKWYLLLGGYSNFYRAVTGDPGISGNVNGCYYDNINVQNTYVGTITITLGGYFGIGNGFAIPPGSWRVMGWDIREGDPYDWNTPTGTSTPLDDHTLVQNNIDFPTLPTAAAINAGFVSVWVPQLFQVQNLANYMWNINLLSADFWKKLVASPLELIYGLSIIPYDFRSAESEYQVHTDNLTLGYVNTKLSMDYIEEQFIDVDMGEIDMKEWAGAYLDYDPQTRISIYLPYIGVKDLNADDVMRKVISLKYRIDLASGACIAMLKCTGTDDVAGEIDSVFYSFPGTCAVSIPVSASQQQELLRSIVSLGIGVTATVATIAGGVTAMGAATAVGATANGALGLKSHYAHSGAMGASPGFMGVQTPYLIINRPRLAIPEDQNVYMGYPSFITSTLGDLSGYTEVEITHLDRLSCTEEEMSEIAELLKKGVFF